MVDRSDSRANLFLSIDARLKHLMIRCRVPACDCEDCIQEARLALLYAHPDWTLEEPRTIAWLCDVARNKARDLHRLRKRHRTQQLDDVSLILVFDPVQTSSELDQNSPHHEILSTLQDALNRLSVVNRQILVQRADQERTYREIGLAVGLKPEQVKEHYHRVVRQLKETLHANAQGCNDDGGGGRKSFLLRVLLISGFYVDQAFRPDDVVLSDCEARRDPLCVFQRITQGFA